MNWFYLYVLFFNYFYELSNSYIAKFEVWYYILLFNWHIFLSDVFHFNFDTRHPETTTLHLTCFGSRAVFFPSLHLFFVSSLQSNSVSAACFFFVSERCDRVFYINPRGSRANVNWVKGCCFRRVHLFPRSECRPRMRPEVVNQSWMNRSEPRAHCRTILFPSSVQMFRPHLWQHWRDHTTTSELLENHSKIPGNIYLGFDRHFDMQKLIPQT